MNEIEERFLYLASASFVLGKAHWAMFQTSEGKRSKTIISVDLKEATVIVRAIRDYIEKWENELKKEKKE